MQMIKKILKFISLIILFLSINYLIGSLIEGSFNMNNWQESARVQFIIYAGVFSIFFASLLTSITEL